MSAYLARVLFCYAHLMRAVNPALWFGDLVVGALVVGALWAAVGVWAIPAVVGVAVLTRGVIPRVPVMVAAYAPLLPIAVCWALLRARVNALMVRTYEEEIAAKRLARAPINGGRP